MSVDKYLADVKARAVYTRKWVERIAADVIVLAPVFKFAVPASVDRINTEIMGGAASAAEKSAPPTIFTDVERLVKMVEVLEKQRNCFIRGVCVREVWDARIAQQDAELDRLAAGGADNG